MSELPRENDNLDLTPKPGNPPVKAVKTWMQEAPGGSLGAILVALALFALGGIGAYMIWGHNTPIDESRSMLAMIFALGTITMAFCLMLGAFLSSGDDSVKDRFAMANQVLTPLIGIMGTILGFYFGTSQGKTSAEPLAVVDVIVAKNTVKPGESLPVTTIVSGGQGPWEFTLTFANNAMPTVKRKVSSQHLRETIAIPTAQTGQLGVTVEVTDSVGATAKVERKLGEWVTIEAAAAPPPHDAPAPPITTPTVPPACIATPPIAPEPKKP